MNENTETQLINQADSKELTAHKKICNIIREFDRKTHVSDDDLERMVDVFLDRNPDLDHAALMLSTLKSARATLTGNAMGTGSMTETMDAIANLDEIIALAEGRE
jgi:hypothetical protein